VTHPEQFWTTLWDFAGVVAGTRGERVLVDANRCPAPGGFRMRA
jgi:hypothetical protein